MPSYARKLVCFLMVRIFLTKMWQMQHSCPDIFTDWKINQVLSPHESVTAFSQAPGVCPMGVLFCLGTWGTGTAEPQGRSGQPGCDLTGFAQEYTPAKAALM